MTDRPSFIGSWDYRMIWQELADLDADEQDEANLKLDSCEDAQYLRSLPYFRYLRSTHWDLMRRRAMARAGYRCQRCDTTTRALQVHHLTYDRLGCEADGDLLVLCSQCHIREHGGADFDLLVKVLGEASAAFIASEGLHSVVKHADAIRKAVRDLDA